MSDRLHNKSPCAILWRALFAVCGMSAFALLPAACASAVEDDDPRVARGRAKLGLALSEAGYVEGTIRVKTSVDPDSPSLSPHARRAEGFSTSATGDRIEVVGFDAAGLLYGCVAMAEEIRREGAVPVGWSVSDAPAMTLRGPCLLLMKLGDYNFPVTPEEFPFFYDRDTWIGWFDFMEAQRFNFLTLWNGHPFAYFVKFERFGEAQSGIDAAQIEQNRGQLHWLVAEAGRRNITLLFEFYNIHTSVYFQKAHGLPDENTKPTPLLRDYTGYAIETFAREFPEIGYYITPGEAIEPGFTDSWVNEVVIPAIRRGGARGPIWLRSWGIDLSRAKKVAEANPDVWMERKFNVEMIADTRPDPENSQWAALSGKFVVNIHMAANLEPFRWFAPDYIRTCVANSMAGGAGGLHLYPRKAWRWPDGSEPAMPVVQWERDRFWNVAWARYAWNPHRDPTGERAWWEAELTQHFGRADAARHFLDAQAVAADALPGLQRLIWLGNDNHTVVASGIRLSQIETAEGIPFLDLPGVAQRIPEYLAVLRDGRTPPAPTPAAFIDDRFAAAKRAAELAAAGASAATRHRSEAAALARDAAAVQLVVEYYREKLRAAELRAQAQASGSPVAADAYLAPLRSSLEVFRRLAAMLDPAYDSVSDVPMWNPFRLEKVPYHWNDLVPAFERELELHRLATSDTGPPPSKEPTIPGLAGLHYGAAGFKRLSGADPVTTLDQDWTDADRGRDWSAEWRGYIVLPRPGPVALRVRSDQPVTIDAGGERVLDGSGFPGARTCTITATSSLAVPIHIGYDHPEGSTAAFEIQWSLDGSTFSPIPPEALRHSEEDRRWADTAVLEVEL